MNTLTPVAHVAVLRADLADAERELDRADALGDAAAVVRIHRSIAPRLRDLRASIARAERQTRDRSDR